MSHEEPEDFTKLRKQRIEDFREVASDPNQAFWFCGVQIEGSDVVSAGLMGTAAARYVFGVLCEDVSQMHRFGRCPSCDRVAMAFIAAKEAFDKVMSAGQQLAHKH